MSFETYQQAQELVIRKQNLEAIRDKLVKCGEITFSPLTGGTSLTISECGNYPDLCKKLKDVFLATLLKDIDEVAEQFKNI